VGSATDGFGKRAEMREAGARQGLWTECPSYWRNPIGKTRFFRSAVT
jgi:hypothetical protein